MRATSKVLLVAATVAAALSLAGCSSVGMRYERAIGAPQLSPTAPASVEILRREPGRPHARLGHVILRPSGDPEITEMERAIREGAGALGADAAVLVRDTTRRIGTVYDGPWWARSSYPIYGRVIVAVAIRYERR